MRGRRQKSLVVVVSGNERRECLLDEGTGISEILSSVKERRTGMTRVRSLKLMA